MCFLSQPAQRPVIAKKSTPAMPRPSPYANLSQRARVTVLDSRGVKDTIATSALGDPSFGGSVAKPTLLGQAA